MAAITRNARRRLFGDQSIVGWRGAGLLFPSAVTGIARTIKRTMIDRRLGTMARAEMGAVDRQLLGSLAP